MAFIEEGVGAEAAWTSWGGLKLVPKLGSPRESLQSMQRANMRKAEVLGCSSAIRTMHCIQTQGTSGTSGNDRPPRKWEEPTQQHPQAVLRGWLSGSEPF